MNKSRKPFSIEECKIQASLLLKSLSSGDIKKAEQAAKQLQRLPEFAEKSLNEIINTICKRKHALRVVAMEHGFDSWNDLIIQTGLIVGGFLNSWFAQYSEAKSYLQAHGGFLLPYKKQYFVCSANYIRAIGLDPHDPDWKLIGWDWVKPEDQKALQRLKRKWKEICGNHKRNKQR